MIKNKHILVNKYLEQHSLVESNIISFNDFVNNRMQQIINEINESLQDADVEIRFGKIKIGNGTEHVEIGLETSSGVQKTEHAVAATQVHAGSNYRHAAQGVASQDHPEGVFRSQPIGIDEAAALFPRRSDGRGAIGYTCSHANSLSISASTWMVSTRQWSKVEGRRSKVERGGGGA